MVLINHPKQLAVSLRVFFCASFDARASVSVHHSMGLDHDRVLNIKTIHYVARLTQKRIKDAFNLKGFKANPALTAETKIQRPKPNESTERETTTSSRAI